MPVGNEIVLVLRIKKYYFFHNLNERSLFQVKKIIVFTKCSHKSISNVSQ